MNNLAQVEGLLFIAGDEGITDADISKITGFMKPAVLELLARLAKKYQQDPDSALQLLHSGNTYRLATKAALAPTMKTYFETPLTLPLTQAQLEVLAIIAYRQPLTRLEIDDLRGVQSSASIQKLVSRNLVETHGRLDVPGRPFKYVTTPAFLDYFGLESLQDLPELNEQLSLDDLDGDIFLQALEKRQQRMNNSNKNNEDNENGTSTESNG